MAVKLGIKNFQSITQAKLSFEPGLTVLVGTNSSGKTAIFRAIRALITNPTRSGATYIQHGAESCQVGLRIDDGEAVWWTRVKGSSSYKVGEEVYAKAGRTKIHTIRMKYPLLVEESGRLLNFHSEWDVLFPFDKTPADLFKMFEDVFQVSSSTTILDLFKDDEVKTKTTVDTLKAQKEKNTNKRVAIEEFKQKVNVSKLQDYQSRYPSSQGELSRDLTQLTEAQQAEKLLSFLKEVKRRDFGTELFMLVKQMEQDLGVARNLRAQVMEMREVKKMGFDTSLLDQLLVLEAYRDTVSRLEAVTSVRLKKQDWDFSAYEEWEKTQNSLWEVKVLRLVIDGNEIELVHDRFQREDLQKEYNRIEKCPLCSQRLPTPHHHQK